MTSLGFDALITPMKRRVFFERCFGRRSEVLRGNAERFAQLDAALDLDALTRASVVHGVTDDEYGRQTRSRVPSEDVASLHGSGVTLYGDVSGEPAADAILQQLHRELRLGAGVGRALLSWSSPGTGLGAQFRAHHGFVLQLSGQTQWWFGETPAVPWATDSGCVHGDGHAVYTTGDSARPVLGPTGATVMVPPREELRHEVLEPGDVLYLPPGTWQLSEAVDDCRALSLSPPRLSTGELIMDLLSRRLSSDAEWAADLRGPVDLEARLGAGLASLREALDALDPVQLEHSWARRVFNAKAARMSKRGAVSLVRRTRLQHAHPGEMHCVAMPGTDQADGGVALFRSGMELAFPPQALRFIKGLVANERFSAREAMVWDPSMSWEATHAALNTLVQFGFVDVVSGAAGERHLRLVPSEPESR